MNRFRSTPRSAARLLVAVCSLVIAADGCRQQPPPQPVPSAEDSLGPGLVFTDDWVSRNTDRWRENLMPLAGRQDLHYLEIGVWEGRSVLWMMDNILTHPSCRVTAVDIFSREIDRVFDHNMTVAGVADRVTKVKGFSRNTLRTLPLDDFDLVYIDGSHAGTDVLSDVALAWDLLKVGGIIIFDDYWMDTSRGGRAQGEVDLPPGLRPGAAIDAWLSIYAQQIEILDADYQVIIRKIPTACKAAPIGGAYEKVKYCTGFGPYVYFWNHRTLHRVKDGSEIPIGDEERMALESMLTADIRWSTPFRIPVKLAENPAYRELVTRLGIHGQ